MKSHKKCLCVKEELHAKGRNKVMKEIERSR
jgi:hypothetical protein